MHCIVHAYSDHCFLSSVKISSAIDAGVLIVDVAPNSPAFVAGLKVCCT